MRVYARQAITTRFLGPTDRRDPRVKATCEAGSLTLPWDDSLDVPDNHARVAQALACKLEWFGPWFLGALPGNAGYVLVNAADGAEIAV